MILTHAGNSMNPETGQTTDGGGYRIVSYLVLRTRQGRESHAVFNKQQLVESSSPRRNSKYDVHTAIIVYSRQQKAFSLQRV
jgi:hypothetical protein